ncbi:MAG: hypothetical protein KDB14_20470 [Planctomycetales bacterium]|nr:hypothetical protein [Planctomycetales bacterium]
MNDKNFDDTNLGGSASHDASPEPGASLAESGAAPGETACALSRSELLKDFFDRHHNHIYGVVGVVALLLTIAFFAYQELSKSRGDTVDLDVRVLRDGKLNDLPEALPLVAGDQLQLSASFAPAAFGAVVWIDQQGNAQLVASSGAKQTEQLSFPEDMSQWVTLEGDAGTEMLLVIASSSPIRDVPAALRGDEGHLAPIAEVAAIWMDPRRIDIMTAKGTRSPGEVVNRDEDHVIQQINQLRATLSSDYHMFRGVAFPHK